MNSDPAFKLNKDLQGLSQLTGDGINGVVDLVEAMHQRIVSLGGLFNPAELNRTSGISGFVYRRIRQTTRLVSQGLGRVFDALPDGPLTLGDGHGRQQWLSILNGVLGDHLQRSNNPLTIPMTLQHHQQAISAQQAARLSSAENSEPLLLIHGLCMNDSLWCRQGHDHGQALQQDVAMRPIYLRYNSGLAVHHNGHQLAMMLQQFLAHLPDDKQLHVLCHSMGGLVMRSAIHLAEQAGEHWPGQLGKVIFLGTPHQGAVLEKTGSLIDYLLSINPYAAPFAKLGQARSQGIKNLRHGTITTKHQTIQLPPYIDAHTLAGSQKKASEQWLGDGLVSVQSALGKHSDPDKQLTFKINKQHIVGQVSHMGLLSDPRVYQTIKMILTR